MPNIGMWGDKLMKWRTQDWIWLLLFSAYAHVFFWIKDDMVLDIISYVSTFVSIALASVAIYISVREATNGDSLKAELNLILGEMREKIGQVDTKVSRIDVNNFSKVYNENFEESLTRLEKRLEGMEQISKDKALEVVREELNNNKEQIESELKKSIYTINRKNFNNPPMSLRGLEHLSVKEIDFLYDMFSKSLEKIEKDKNKTKKAPN